MKIDSLEALLEDQLKDIYDAENQLLKALPKLASAARNEHLRAAREEVKAAGRQAEARLHESKQRVYQSGAHLPERKEKSDEPSAPRAVAETVKGAAKQAADDGD